MTKPWAPYDHEAGVLAAQYETLPFEVIHAKLLGVIPDRPGAVLDVGAGSGRDAAWFAEHGHSVIAAEPSLAMQDEGIRRHPGRTIQWIPDALPDLGWVSRCGLSFDFILLSGVWMHVAPAERPRAFRKLAALLAPGGRLALTLRHGPVPPGRTFYAVTSEELEALAARNGLAPVLIAKGEDALDRPGVTWTTLVFQLPDDATGALPLLRSIILRDRRSSTYKLALLRVLCRIAESHPGMALPRDDDSVELPMGLVALGWLRAYLPLFRMGLPQHPQEAAGFARMLGRLDQVDPQQLRPGLAFCGQAARDLRSSMIEAVSLVDRMPVRHISAPGSSGHLFSIIKGRSSRATDLCLDEPTLWSFGSFVVPGSLWRTFLRLAPWIDPLLRQEWAGYMSALQGATSAMDHWGTLAWTDPVRDTREVRAIAEGLIQQGGLRCTWTDRRLESSTLDVDHAFPMAVWPCQDLWNLVPAHRSVNLQKSDRLLSSQRLKAAQERLEEWWDRAFFKVNGSPLEGRFMLEARMSLALPESPKVRLQDVYQGMALKRLALSRVHAVPEWV